MRLDEFQFVLIDKETRNEVAVCFNDLYGYFEVIKNSGNHDGILVRYNNDHPKGKEHYIPKFWEGMVVSRNCSYKSGECNSDLLVKYAPMYSYEKYPELELSDFKFKVTNMQRNEGVIITFADLIAHEAGRWHLEPQGIFIEKDKVDDMPDCLSGTIFVNNNGYFFDGFNPILDVEYVGNSVGNCRRKENRKSIFVNSLDDIINNANSSESIKAQIVNVIEIAKQYSFYQKHWNDFSLQELSQRNKERKDVHDLFIIELNKLAEDITKFTGREITWKKILGDDRKKLGDFAEYIADYVDKVKNILIE